MLRNKEAPPPVAAGEGAEGSVSGRADSNTEDDITLLLPGAILTASELLAQYEARKASLSMGEVKSIPKRVGLHYRQGKLIEVYPGRGVRTVTVFKHCPNPEGKGGGKRKQILTWSAASRKRAREVLLSSSGPDGWGTFGVTLTIPGPVATFAQQRELWRRYCLDLAKYGWLMIWRMEVQQRGAWHWHALLTVPEDGGTVLPDPYTTLDVPTAIRGSWYIALDRLPAVDGYTDKGVAVPLCVRSQWPGASDHAVDVTSEGATRGAWLRYMSDHATKAKQEQIGVNVGRHWGIVGRKHLESLQPASSEALTDRQAWAYLRAKQRLATPRIVCPLAPFGRKLGYRIRRGTVGSSVWFCNVATDRRLIEWARGLYPQ